MLAPPQLTAVKIRRVRARHPGGPEADFDRLLRDALGRAVRPPASLGSSAILCVRFLQDPLPGCLVFSQGRTSPSSRWAAAMDARLGALADRAARPARGCVPAAAEAVRFDDFAEVLQCLARDWRAGPGAARWWWQSLFPGRGIWDAAREAWLANPASVPGAVARLHANGEAEPFLSALPESIAFSLAERVSQTFGLQTVHDAFKAILASRPEGAAIGSMPSMEDAGGAGERAGRTNAPWTPWVAMRTDLPRCSEELLVLSVLLERAPVVLRSTRFARAVLEWRNPAPRSDGPPAPAAAPLAPRPASLLRASVWSGVQDSPEEGRRAELDGAVDRRPVEGRSASSFPSGAVESRAPLEPRVQAAGVEALRQTRDFEAQAAGAGLTVTEFGKSSNAPPESGGAQWNPDRINPADPGDVRFSTAWGGVFYLVNVALVLEIYPDFTHPRAAGLPMPLWDWLELTARRLIGEDVASDPLFDAFARLSGRAPDELPGRLFDPETDWTTPAALAEALAQMGRSPWTQSPVAAETQTAAPASRAFEPGHLRRWLDWLVPCLEQRLRLALGLGLESNLADALLRHAAQVTITSERVEVRFSLAQHPIEIRCAGLDRDPGWAPAAGRTFTFHYE